MDFRISLTGDLGSGKSTVGKILSEKYDAKIYSTGPIIRKMAEDRGLSVGDFNKLMESDPKIDNEMDDRLKLLSKEPGNLIIDSRMAWFFTEGTFRVYLATAIEESAKRIFNDPSRKSETFKTVEEAEKKIRERKQSENLRYKNLYGADCSFMGNYDLVVDTTASPAEAAAEIISESYKKYLNGEETVKIYMYGGRLLPTYEISEEEIKTAVETKDEPLDTPVNITVCNGEMFITNKEDAVKALRCVATGNNLIPCVAEYTNTALEVADNAKAKWKNTVDEIKPKKK
ncbi:MAG: cytidylate kinase family protein [Clostridia bacterium]|nr:cytidylate kinase family protein [Clostridia bacterium]